MGRVAPISCKSPALPIAPQTAVTLSAAWTATKRPMKNSAHIANAHNPSADAKHGTPLNQVCGAANAGAPDGSIVRRGPGLLRRRRRGLHRLRSRVLLLLGVLVRRPAV